MVIVAIAMPMRARRHFGHGAFMALRATGQDWRVNKSIISFRARYSVVTRQITILYVGRTPSPRYRR